MMLEFVRVDDSEESAVWSVLAGDEIVYVETGSNPDDSELIEAISVALKEEQ